ncbi:MAG: hypothetical protein M3O28_04630 [Actinomycetota bacterium]|nr:hypothetical protein [Actinomycetota bacterium]
MADVLIRGLSDTAVAQLNAAAGAVGLSRNEFLRRQFEAATPTSGLVVTAADLRRAAEAASDLREQGAMAAAWR